MQAGSLRHQIVFQSRDTTVDSYGQQATTWTDTVTCRAKIEAISAREIFAAQAVGSEVTHKITVRYQAALSNPKTVAAMRISYGGRIFNIAGGFNVDERNRAIEVLASEGLNNG